MEVQRLAEVWLKRERRKRIEAGHPWVYRGEIAQVKGDPATGDAVQVRNHQGHFLGQGFYHDQSQIAVRIATHNDRETLDAVWLRGRMAQAYAYRKRWLPQVEFGRMVYGEADGLPGLIVDRYGAVAVLQIASAAMDKRLDSIVEAVREVFGVEAIYERSDAPTRSFEGLAPRTGCLLGPCPDEVEIKENGLRFVVDIAHGNKTGHFYDQRDNRAAIASVVRFAADEKPRPDLRYREGVEEPAVSGRRGAQVLDCFCHSGGFALHALHYGAAHVTAVDISGQALDAARRNADLNGYGERLDLVAANAFDLLREYERLERRFDVVILDPPAFAKNRQAVEGALRGYKDINLRAQKLISDGGFLVTASCSHPVSVDMWRAVVAEAAEDAHKVLRLVELRGLAKDHPQLVGMPENDYLKFAIYEVRSRG